MDDIIAILRSGITVTNLKHIISIWGKIPPDIKDKLKKAIREFFNKSKMVSFDYKNTNSELFTIDKSSSNFRRLKSALISQEYIAILRVAELIKWLNLNNLHNEAEERRKEVYQKYRQKGINIVDMVGTGDIGTAVSYLDRLNGEPAQQKLLFNQFFDKFVNNYTEFCLMIQSHMQEIDVEKGILGRVGRGSPFVLVRFLGDKKRTDKLDSLLLGLLEEPSLDGYELQRNVSKLGKKFQYQAMFVNPKLVEKNE
ncbi:MAG: hypothetical protein Q7K34_04755 [archaeon]|nr:hypothetical protein [archaeon]